MKITFLPNTICLRCGSDKKEAKQHAGCFRASRHIWNKDSAIAHTRASYARAEEEGGGDDAAEAAEEELLKIN